MEVKGDSDLFQLVVLIIYVLILVSHSCEAAEKFLLKVTETLMG